MTKPPLVKTTTEAKDSATEKEERTREKNVNRDVDRFVFGSVAD